MSLGFIVPAITNSKVLPDKSLSRSSTPAVRTAQFGDGYQQRVADGLNSIAESYSVSFANRGKSVADDIISFFTANKGVTSFNFTLPDTNSTSSATATTTGAPGSTTTISLTSSTNNLDITPGATVLGQSVSVVSIVGTTLELSGAKNFTTGTALTFTNPNEKTVKVVCATWQQTYTELLGSSVTATFNRVYEP
tara:strand:- start:1188 stop:1769 length:582 start_codon:yes stop_codon:yes gene_type:complete